MTLHIKHMVLSMITYYELITSCNRLIPCVVVWWSLILYVCWTVYKRLEKKRSVGTGNYGGWFILWLYILFYFLLLCLYLFFNILYFFIFNFLFLKSSQLTWQLGGPIPATCPKLVTPLLGWQRTKNCLPLVQVAITCNVVNLRAYFPWLKTCYAKF